MSTQKKNKKHHQVKFLLVAEKNVSSKICGPGWKQLQGLGLVVLEVAGEGWRPSGSPVPKHGWEILWKFQ